MLKKNLQELLRSNLFQIFKKCEFFLYRFLYPYISCIFTFYAHSLTLRRDTQSILLFNEVPQEIKASTLYCIYELSDSTYLLIKNI